MSLFLGIYLRRKWGNRPFINREHRQQRVYLYQDGLVKQTAKRCDVVLWSQMYDSVYTPPKVGEQSGFFDSQRASIQLSRSSGRMLTLSGALLNIEDLAWRIKQACEHNRHIAVHMDKLPPSPI